MKHKIGAGTRRNLRFASVRSVLSPLLSLGLFAGCAAARSDIILPSPRPAAESVGPRTDRMEARPLHTSSVVTGEILFLRRGGPPVDLGATVVYLRPRQNTVRWQPSETVIRVSSKTAAFAPPLTVVHPGQSVILANDGPLVHRLFSSDLGGETTELAPGTRSARIRIRHRGAARFYCSLHSDETFVVFAADAAHVAVISEKDGYTFESVPPGRYTLSIWSERVAGPVRDVRVDGFSRLRAPIWLDSRLIDP